MRLTTERIQQIREIVDSGMFCNVAHELLEHIESLEKEIEFLREKLRQFLD
jgi:hypothetical protein